MSEILRLKIQVFVNRGFSRTDTEQIDLLTAKIKNLKNRPILVTKLPRFGYHFLEWLLIDQSGVRGSLAFSGKNEFRNWLNRKKRCYFVKQMETQSVLSDPMVSV